MGLSEDEKRKNIERGNAYNHMMALWAWQDFMKILDRHVEDTIRTLDSSETTTLVEFGEIRGRLKEIRNIKNEVDYIRRYSDEP